ncbi:helix-turn-helix domain-containing protein [Roseibium algae]|uniref:Helix-turn-helix domain-containing protein n=1 Tax=Roseibium algae TaxID=3123038 RepID=A0ABU8TK49_9HYPH
MKLLDISEISKQTGVAASAMRHYEEKGLIVSVGRRGMKRLFGPEILDQLALITLGKTAGFSLEEIKSMFGPNGQPQISRHMLSAKADDLDAQIRKMTSLSRLLRHTADCKAPSHMECPTFRRYLAAASGHNQRKNAPTSKRPNTPPQTLKNSRNAPAGSSNS